MRYHLPYRARLASAALLITLPLSAFAQPRVEIRPSSVTLAAGGPTTQTFEVHVMNYTELGGMSLSIFYDPSVVTVTATSRRGEYIDNAGGMSTCQIYNKTTDGILQIDCSDLSTTQPGYRGYTGTDAVVFAFTLQRVGPGTTVLTFNDNYFNYSQDVRIRNDKNVPQTGYALGDATVAVDRPLPAAAVMRTLLDFEPANRDSAETAYAPMGATATRHRVRNNGSGGRLTVARYDTQAPGGNGAPYTDPDGTLASFGTPERYWELTNSFTGSYLQDVAFSYAGLPVADPSQLRVARRALTADGTATWQVIPAARTTVNTTTQEVELVSATASDVTSGQYALVAPIAALPVELSAFTAVADGADALLRWTTASETRSARFTVEHRAPAAAVWSTVGERAAQGTTSEAHAYSLRVPSLDAGRHAFRLSETDLDGTSRVLGTVELAVEAREALSLRPTGETPVRGLLSARLSVAADERVRVDLVDVTGRTVAILHNGPAASGNALTLQHDAAALPAGAYWLRARSTRDVRTVPLIVTR